MGNGKQFIWRSLAHMILECTREPGRKEFTRLGWRIRPIDMLNDFLLTDALVIQLEIMQPLLHILRRDGFMVLRNSNRSGNLQDVRNQKWGEDDHAVYSAAKLMFVGRNGDLCGRGEIGGQVGVAQPPIGNGPPRTIRLRRQLPVDETIWIQLFIRANIFQSKWGDTTAID